MFRSSRRLHLANEEGVETFILVERNMSECCRISLVVLIIRWFSLEQASQMRTSQPIKNHH